MNLEEAQKLIRQRRKRWKTLRIMSLVGVVGVIIFILCDMCRAKELPVVYKDIPGLTVVTTNPTLDQTMVEYTGMNISFNPSLHLPNWVAWELTADEVRGREKRASQFWPDTKVEGCATQYDYSYSGYDRGHMAPAGDMKWSREAMNESFSFVNICPQSHELNSGAWRHLEERCRVWASADSAIYIVCGPVLTDSLNDYIGNSHVAVPQRFFKVIISPYAQPARGIGFVMANDVVPGGMQSAAMSIDEVEHITGHDFFASLPDELEERIESQNDFHYWSTVR